MKRQYIIPKLRAVEVQTNELIAESLPKSDQWGDEQWVKEERTETTNEPTKRNLWGNEW